MAGEYETKFDKCPVCKLREELAEILGKPELNIGSGESRFLESIGNIMKELGFARPDWNFHMSAHEGVAIDPQNKKVIPVDSSIPGYKFTTDICADCGCIYAKVVKLHDVKVVPPPPNIVVPGQENRAQRRRDAREPRNPFSSS